MKKMNISPRGACPSHTWAAPGMRETANSNKGGLGFGMLGNFISQIDQGVHELPCKVRVY